MNQRIYSQNPIDPKQVDFMKDIGVSALLQSFKTHEKIGEHGIEMIQNNQFGDMAMRGDIEAENAVLSHLKKQDISIIIQSEEHGETHIGTSPSYFGVLDGIDGSAWYKSDRGIGRYGTLLGIYNGTDPCYKDYIFGGIMEHATKRLIYGVKGKGSYVYDLVSDTTTPIHTSRTNSLTKQTNIHIDQFWEINKHTFLIPLSEYRILDYHLCSSVHYANVALGASDLALECTRKNNLEIAAVFGLIHEAGGVMITHDGKDLSNLPYKTFGQTSHVPVITAASRTLADQTVKFLEKNISYI